MNLVEKSILVTGTAGFIGFHVTKKLLSQYTTVVALDNINDYYDVTLKYSRLNELGIQQSLISDNQIVESKIYTNFKFIKLDLTNSEGLKQLFSTFKFNVVINLAAQAGVRYSLQNPQTYIDCNVTGFLNILECCRYHQVKNLIYASSSSVYGLLKNMPFEESNPTEHPMSMYAATKKANEMMAHTYSHLFGLATTGLRFFTVYGPWGRPDMALFIFAKAIAEQKPFQLFNYGKMIRDFTYIDDIVNSIAILVEKPAKADPNFDNTNPKSNISSAPYKIYNIGNSNPILLTDFIKEIEHQLGKKAIIEPKEIQAGDVEMTSANNNLLFDDINYRPKVGIPEGVKNFIDWYKAYYKV